MRIFINSKETSKNDWLSIDPTFVDVEKYWGKTGFISKSAIDLRFFSSPFGSVSLLFGPRQIGKTASLKLYLSQMKDSETAVFTDCSTILNRSDLNAQLVSLIKGKTTIVLDEVQEVQGWHLALRALHGEGLLRECRVWCTGSEARHLMESGERLPGRKGEGRNLFLRPWSFREYMDLFHADKTAPIKDLSYRHVTQDWLQSTELNWKSHWDIYCLTGGFPKAVAEYRKRGTLSDETFRVYSDWILGTWSRLRTPERSLSALSRRLCETMNSRVSFEKLRSGTDIQSSNTVKTLLEMQEDHFSIRVIPRFDIYSGKFLPSKLKKIYPLDPFIAHVWSLIGNDIRRLCMAELPALKIDECAFQAQTFRREGAPELSYLYSEASKSEVDFFFDECAVELKSNGSPTPKQRQIMNAAPRSFSITGATLPLMAYLVGEKRWEGT